MTPISIAFVDEHPLLLTGVNHLFQNTPGFAVLGSGKSATDLLEIARRAQPDVILADLTVPGNVLGAIQEITREKLPTKVLIFTGVSAVDPAIAVLEAGAKGYVLKHCLEADLITAVRAVQDGETYISPSFATKVVTGMRAASMQRASAAALRLTSREEQVLRLVLRGMTNREIGVALSLSDKTIKHYMSVLMQRLNARNRIEVVLTAQELGMQVDHGRQVSIN